MFALIAALALVATFPVSIDGTVANTANTGGYASYSDLDGKPYTVTFDQRSLKINGAPTLFVSGAIHPPRGTPAMWQTWFRLAKANGLNMIQVYIFWNFHEPTEGALDFSGRGNLTLFMQGAQEAGLFVNLRIGPYVCAEWTYGGIPAWLGQKPGVAFRQSNPVWQPAMEKFFNLIIDMMAKGNFFATQGGPIVLTQVENELHGSNQQYVDWCGTMAETALKAVNVSIPITMCNGQTAATTINTCNGNDCSGFLKSHGQNGKILITQPALWTENEGGFQTWGGAPPPGGEPYFWGRSMADQAGSVMIWFALGGSHMDYYMWTGGNNYGRWTGDGITHMYAVDAIVCPDGLKHEPKFSHTQAMHNAIATAADDIVSVPAQLNKGITLDNPAFTAYVYNTVAFIVNSKWKSATTATTVTYDKKSYSVMGIALVNTSTGAILFDSAAVTTGSQKSPRRAVKQSASLSMWKYWSEPITSSSVPTGFYPSNATFMSPTPMEMTNITSALTTFAYYETTISMRSLVNSTSATTLSIPTHNGQAFVAFVDGKQVGDAEDHSHGSGGAKTLTIDLSNAGYSAGDSTLTLLAEELGYANYGFMVPLYKGIHSSKGALPTLGGAPLTSSWKMRSGLAGEHLQVFTPAGASKVSWKPTSTSLPTGGIWYTTTFVTPSSVNDNNDGDQLLLQTLSSGLGRGRFWVNGHEVGRYWTKERNDASACPAGAKSCATQQYYHIPAAWVNTAGSDSENVLTIFETVGQGTGPMATVSISTMSSSSGADTVDPTKVVSCEF
eukprot:m.191403 g.191403  ORF g.191403 m.191403 type:complete len:783 (+) comp32431_c0_seq1:96-2444(+)